jgi:hypothetical protein
VANVTKELVSLALNANVIFSSVKPIAYLKYITVTSISTKMENKSLKKTLLSAKLPNWKKFDK